MKSILQLWLTLAIVAATPAAFAAADDDVTIMVVDEGATPDDVVKVIELPGSASANATSKSAAGIDNANTKSESGRDLGQQISEDARVNANDQVRGDAAQNARNDARSDNAGAANRHGPH